MRRRDHGFLKMQSRIFFAPHLDSPNQLDRASEFRLCARRCGRPTCAGKYRWGSKPARRPNQPRCGTTNPRRRATEGPTKSRSALRPAVVPNKRSRTMCRHRRVRATQDRDPRTWRARMHQCACLEYGPGLWGPGVRRDDIDFVGRASRHDNHLTTPRTQRATVRAATSPGCGAWRANTAATAFAMW